MVFMKEYKDFHQNSLICIWLSVTLFASSVEPQEYIEFLDRGYKVVFQELIENDKPKLPACWGEELKGKGKIKKGDSMVPTVRCADMMAQILFDKIAADNVTRGKHAKMGVISKMGKDGVAANGVQHM